MNYYKCIVSYDGTGYCGWQLQPDCPTIVSTLQSKFYKVFACDATIIGASRTDAGVHALGQVALCRTDLTLPADKLMWAWNNRLPADIKICSVQSVDQLFHPQHNVVQKTYKYHFFLERPCPLVARYGMYVRRIPDLEKLQKCLELFVGMHDFRSFCTGDEMGDNTVRTIDKISLHYCQQYRAYCIEIKGPSFLRYMIRRIVGGCLTVAARSYLPVEYLQDVLHERNPQQQLPTAQAQGLLLYEINYEDAELNT